MTFTAQTTAVTATDYNNTLAVLDNMLGLGEDGWGLPLLSSSPTSTKNVIRAYEYNNLLKDINVAHTHITNANTSTAAVITGTTLVSAAYANELLDTTNWLHNVTRRYTCHPDQFFKAQLSAGGTTSTIIPTSGVSVRTNGWGSGTNSTSIMHKAISAFRSRLAARYYFNQGNYLTFTPFYQGVGLNDLDAEWTNFIDWINTLGDNFTYQRSDYLSGDKTKQWNSGSLYVNVVADRATDQSSINFTITYGNNSSPKLLVSPNVAAYRVVIPSGLSLSHGRVNNAFIFATIEDTTIISKKAMPLRKFNHKIINPKRSYSQNFRMNSILGSTPTNNISRPTGI